MFRFANADGTTKSYYGRIRYDHKSSTRFVSQIIAMRRRRRRVKYSFCIFLAERLRAKTVKPSHPAK